ncbi:hypothetical protein EDB92DRAFT_1884078 [Lactarius akahatsu]|uniref:Uncharacterized protein n=1 Tax=Lactarius akahatsu TaxID=416441 RepID=A0AAD4Q576_9AGAM|nr:hypothetical protein EDB92DRAFT_1884078 [Lactarius akahatsu]
MLDGPTKLRDLPRYAEMLARVGLLMVLGVLSRARVGAGTTPSRMARSGRGNVRDFRFTSYVAIYYPCIRTNMSNNATLLH